MRFRGLVLAALATVVASASGASAVETLSATEPQALGAGDQVVLYYDARDGFTTFVNLRNEGDATVTVNVLFYGPTFGAPFTQSISLGGRATRTIDVGQLKASGLPAQAGAAFATVVNGGGQSIVSRSLTGNFTVANLATNAAFGGPGLARSAVTVGSDAEPPVGTVIDGVSVALTTLTPSTASLAVYYNPATLAPAAQGGNQLIFLSFNDLPGAVFTAQAALTTWNVNASLNTGTISIAVPPLAVSGVTLTDLVSIAGPGINGAAGGITFVASGGGAANRTILFAEALGTFGTGYALPATSADVSGVQSVFGDQIVFYYDARDGFTTFLNVRDEGSAPVTVSLLFYGPTFAAPFSRSVTVAAHGTRTIDVGQLRGSGLPAQVGAAFATAVNGSGQPVVVRALAGNFTVANLATQSAFGAAGLVRSAVGVSGGGVSTPALGTVINGASVALRPIRPTAPSLAVYYDPAQLTPAVGGANQLVFLSFDDVAGSTFSAQAAPTTWAIGASRNTGASIAAPPFVATGVAMADLATVIGAGVNGAAGGVVFAADGGGASNRAIIFSESLGTFATGYVLPDSPPGIAESVSQVTDDDGNSGTYGRGGAPASSPGSGTSADASLGNGGVIPGGSNQVTVDYHAGGNASLAAAGSSTSLIIAVLDSDGTFLDNFFELPLPSTDGQLNPHVALSQQLALRGFSLAFATRSDGIVSQYTRLPQSPIRVKTGKVQVSLSWFPEQDLDLHVVQPDGEEIYSGHPRSKAGGVLDLEANADCQNITQPPTNNENVVYPFGIEPPHGQYIVRVDYAHTCNDLPPVDQNGPTPTDLAPGNARFTVTVNKNGAQHLFNGVARLPADGGGAGAGVEITRFTFP